MRQTRLSKTYIFRLFPKYLWSSDSSTCLFIAMTSLILTNKTFSVWYKIVPKDLSLLCALLSLANHCENSNFTALGKSSTNNTANRVRNIPSIAIPPNYGKNLEIFKCGSVV